MDAETRISYDVMRTAEGLQLTFPDREPITLTPEQAWGLGLELNAMATMARQHEFIERRRDEIATIDRAIQGDKAEAVSHG